MHDWVLGSFFLLVLVIAVVGAVLVGPGRSETHWHAVLCRLGWHDLEHEHSADEAGKQIAASKDGLAALVNILGAVVMAHQWRCKRCGKRKWM
jgi:hypothetical protein